MFLTPCRFLGCESILRGGGAVELEIGSHTTVSDSVFDGCRALRGGALDLIEGSSYTNINACRITSCAAVSPSPEGWLCTEAFDDALIVCAGQGGGVCCDPGASLNMYDTLIQKCAAGERGGAVYASTSFVVILNSSLLENSAREAGGGVAAIQSSIEILRSHISFSQSCNNGTSENCAEADGAHCDCGALCVFLRTILRPCPSAHSPAQ